MTAIIPLTRRQKEILLNIYEGRAWNAYPSRIRVDGTTPRAGPKGGASWRCRRALTSLGYLHSDLTFKGGTLTTKGRHAAEEIAERMKK